MQLISPSTTVREATKPRPPVRSRNSVVRKISIIVLFLLPSAILYLVLVLLPVVQAAYYSLFSWSGLGPLTNFIGIKNFVSALSNGVFLRAFGDNIVIVVLSLLIQLPFSLMLALVIGKTLPGRTIIRTIFFLPFILSEVIAGEIWSFIYRPDGLLNIILSHVIAGFQPQAWLGDPRLVLGSIFFVMIWKYFGLHFVLYVAGIQNIPDEVVEAARIDGASGLQVARYVNIPLLGSTIRLTILLSALGSLQIFDLIWIMSEGGPVHASEVMSTYLYTYGFRNFALGYGSAIGMIMFATCFVFAIVYQRVLMRRDMEGSLTEATA